MPAKSQFQKECGLRRIANKLSICRIQIMKQRKVFFLEICVELLKWR